MFIAIKSPTKLIITVTGAAAYRTEKRIWMFT